jgi:hypothetical protein
MCPKTCEKLLGLTMVPPLNACTYIGLDDGAAALKLSLFVDMIKTVCRGGSGKSAPSSPETASSSDAPGISVGAKRVPFIRVFVSFGGS